MGRVASLEGPAPTAGELSSTIGRIRDLITEANKETDVNAPPASLTEVDAFPFSRNELPLQKKCIEVCVFLKLWSVTS